MSKLILLNIVLFFVSSLLLSENLKNKLIKLIYSIFFSSIISLQLISVFLTQNFIGYEFIIHFNYYDIMSMFEFFSSRFYLIILIWIVLNIFLYNWIYIVHFMINKKNVLSNVFASKLLKRLWLGDSE